MAEEGNLTMFPLKSSNLAAAGFEDGQEYPLVIEFASGSLYRYPGTASDVAALRASPSPGRFFVRHIKERPFRRIA